MVASIGELGQPSLRIPFEGTPLNLWQDVRYGERMLRKSPGFTITAVLTLGLGIGATTAVFSVCDALLWKPIALPHLESLVMVLERDPGDPNDWNSGVAADLEDIRRESTSLQGLATWQGGMANIVGQNIRLDDQNFLVTGVMPASFDFPMATELWTPHAFTAAERANRRNNQLEAAARLRPGRTLQQAGAELDRVSARLEKSYPDTNKGRRYIAWTARRFLVDAYTQQYVIMLLCSVIFVLLIACANVANLQFARRSEERRVGKECR